MARKKKCPEHVDHERWLVSYADFITLLFAFFVVMYATASVNLGKFKILSDSLYGAFKGQPRVPEPIQVGIVSKSPNLNVQLKRKVKERMKKKVKMQKFTNVSELVGGKSQEELKKDTVSKAENSTVSKSKSKNKDKSKSKSKSQSQEKIKQEKTPTKRQKDAKGEKILDKKMKVDKIKSTKKGMKSKEKVLMGKLMAKIAQKLKKQFSNLINKERINIRHNNKFIAVELNNHFFFSKGGYKFNKAAIPVVGRLVEVLAKYPEFPIIIEGHTTKQGQEDNVELSPWELSSLRATGLIHILTDFSIKPTRLTASSFASFKPAYDNDTLLGRRKNRRTTILIKADPQNTQFLRMLKKMPEIDYDKIYDYSE